MLGPKGFDGAIIGVGTVATSDGDEEVLVYDVSKIIDILIMNNDGWSFEDAQEYVAYNILGVFTGEVGPCFVHSMGTLFPQEKDIIH